jgi:catechol 2,3-dioxygenase-like lactoylglutathione lyase family enzyme
MIHGLRFVMINVPSIAAVRDFYTETLGFTVVDEQPGFLQLRAASDGGADYAIGESTDAKPAGVPALWWLVDDADATFAELKGKGVPVVSEPADQPFGRTFAFSDPAGNTLRFWQER